MTEYRYNQLSKELCEQIKIDKENHKENPYAFQDNDMIRRNMNRDKSSVLRPPFVRDVEKIMNVPHYCRYSDKTQVFSLQKNDDISRRSYHVQLVARIARNIGRLLNLNLDLIEAIALGHDIGHTPFGHAGESKLSNLYYKNTNRYFNHNIHSARVLDIICPLNLTLQTLDGIICHNGELELQEYRPKPYMEFDLFDKKMENCYIDKSNIETLVPSTLEGCVVRISDIIAYLGKDRQDAIKIGAIKDDKIFDMLDIGNSNAEIINNIIVNIVENSYGKPYLKMDENVFTALKSAKKENSNKIYKSDAANRAFDDLIYPMFEEMYDRLKSDLVNGDESSMIFKHHIDYVNSYRKYYIEHGEKKYEERESIDDIVVDYIAGMTDDYFIDLYDYLFPDGKYKVTYLGYFD